MRPLELPKIPCLIFVLLLLIPISTFAAASSDLLRAAYYNDATAIQKLLSNGANVNSKNNQNVTALNLATARGHLDSVKLLLNNGANPNIAPDNGYTPLIRAAQFGYFEILKLLIVHNANVNSQTKDGATALIFASQLDDKGNTVDILLKNGADVNAKSYDGTTALYLAASENRIYIAQKLINSGAQIDSTIETGASPLIVAVQQGHLDMVKMLVENGANIYAKYKIKDYTNVINPSGNEMKAEAKVESITKTALTMAQEKNHQKIVNFLLSEGAGI